VGCRELSLEVVIWLASLFIKGYMMGVRIYVDRRLTREPVRPGGPVISAFWHGHMLIPLVIFRNRPITVLVSRSRDGERIARVARHFGLGAVRGSTSRGASVAMKELFQLARKNSTHIAVTPDGPRGPRHQVAPGVIYLAQKTGLPILPMAVGLDRYWVPPSKWDEFLVPRPFAQGLVRAGELFWVPAELSSEQMEQYRQRLQDEMGALTRATYAEAQRADLADDPTLTVAY